MVGVEGHKDGPFRIYSYVRGGYCEVGRRRVSEEGEAGRGIEVEECEVGVYEGVCDVGTPNLRLVICSLTLRSRALDVEVSHNDATAGV